jgi:hypothetical protein
MIRRGPESAALVVPLYYNFKTLKILSTQLFQLLLSKILPSNAVPF